MKLYIPKHLLGLDIMVQLSKMVSAYATKVEKDTTTSTERINFNKSLDPVKRFIYLSIPSDAKIFTSGSQTYADVVNYLSSLFYSVKGTQKVVDYMKKYLGFDDKSIVYDAKNISVYPPEINLTDETTYYKSLMDFLGALLYFEDIKTDLGAVGLVIKHTVTSQVSLNPDVHCYKIITIKR